MSANSLAKSAPSEARSSEWGRGPTEKAQPLERLPATNTWADPTAELPASARRGPWGPWRLLAWVVASAVLSLVVIAPLDTWSQLLFGATVFGLAFLVSRFAGRYITLTLVVISVTVSLRYLYWRATTTLGAENSGDLALGLVLFAAEIYAVVVLLLGYVQTAWPLRRKPVALPDDTSLWPTVDIYIQRAARGRPHDHPGGQGARLAR